MSAYQERWQRIAQDAAQQSEQWSIPRVTSLMNLSQMANEYEACQAKYILTERNSAPGLFNTQISTSTMEQILLMIGPEGGWTEEELNKTKDLGFLPLSLGRSILRAETATLAALSLIQGKLGNLG
jgi:16S rRNA (uracil1498-N3)-methyltransferase